MNSIFSKTLRIAIVALLLGASGAPRAALAAEGYKVIVHQSNPMTSVPREQVARFFLKKVTSWPAGRSVSPVDREKDAVTRRAFSQDVLHKSVAEVTAYWQQQFFSGRAVPPPRSTAMPRSSPSWSRTRGRSATWRRTPTSATPRSSE